MKKHIENAVFWFLVIWFGMWVASCEGQIEIEERPDFEYRILETKYVKSTSKYIQSGDYGYLYINGWDVYIDDFIPFMNSHYVMIQNFTMKEPPGDKVIYFGFTSYAAAYTRTTLNKERKGVIIIPTLINDEKFFHEVGHHIHEFNRTVESDRHIKDMWLLEKPDQNVFEWFADLYAHYRLTGERHQVLEYFIGV